MLDTEHQAEASEPPERRGPGAAVAAMSIPPVRRRGIGAFLEIFLYCIVTMIVAVVEHYVERIVPDDDGFLNSVFGPIDAAMSGIAQSLYNIELNIHDLFGDDEAYAASVVSATEALDGYRNGPVGDFAISNWVLGFVVYAIWSLATARRSTTPAVGILQSSFVNAAGKRAGFGRTIVRTSIRALVLFGIPLFVFRFLPSPVFADSQLLWIVLFGAAGALIAWAPLHRAPWDLIAGTTLVETFGIDRVVDRGPITIGDFKVDGVRQAQNRRARRMLNGAGWGAIIVSLLIIWVVFSEAFQFVTADEFEWGLLNIGGERRGWFPRRNQFDIWTLLVGTFWVTGIAMAVAGPVGLGVAIFLSEYAKPRVQRIIKPIIETLASVPSVVIGMFAIFFISPSILQNLFDDTGIFSILAAGIGVGILTIPLVASISEDALRAVPQELREAAYGLGSRKITTALRVVFPAALSGISAAFIVGISRAIGETMVVAIAAGGSGGTLFETDPLEPGQTITAAMASLGAGTDQVAGSGIAFQSLYFLGALLFIMTLLLNIVSDSIVRRFREAY